MPFRPRVLLLAWLTGIAAASAQPAAPLLQPLVLHDFVNLQVVNRPDGIVGLADGSALLTSNGSVSVTGVQTLSTIARLRPDGSVSTLRQFPAGDDVINTLVTHDGTTFFGATVDGGANGQGSVFTIRRDGAFAELYSFTGGEDGRFPVTIIAGLDNTIYVSALAPIHSLSTETAVRVLRVEPDNAVIPNAYGFPVAVSAVGVDGTAYGVRDSGTIGEVLSRSPAGVVTTLPQPLLDVVSLSVSTDGTVVGFGRRADACVVFRDTPAVEIMQTLPTTVGCRGWNFGFQRDLVTGDLVGFATTLLVRFARDGSLLTVKTDIETFATATRMPDGSFWLAERSSPLAACGVETSAGRVRALQDDTLTTVAAFASNTPDGQPRSLVADPDGLFGVTVGGPDAGAIFRLSPAGTFAVLHRFTCGADGGSPQLLLRTDEGALYGTTRAGPNQFGTVFRVDRQSDGIQTLFTFQRPEDGKNPYFLMDGRDGFLYGLTQSGGLSDRGTLFRLAPGGEFTVLRHFAPSDGYVPSLTLAADKQIYAVETLASCSLGPFRCFGRFDRVSRRGDLVALTSQRGLDVPLPLVAGGDGRLYGTLYGGATLVAATDGGLTFLVQSFTPSYGDATGVLGLVADASGTTFAHLTNTTITPFVRLGGDRGLFNLVDGLDGYVYAIGSGSLFGPFGTSIVRFTPSALSAPRGVRIVR